MSIQDRISHATAVTKWKADQQMRLLKSQNQVREIEVQVRQQRSNLADATLSLYAEQKLEAESLQEICAAIDALKAQIQEQIELQQKIKQEQPPQLMASTPHPTFVEIPGIASEDVRENDLDLDSSPAPVASAATGLMCPQCKRPLAVRFCPDHGLEGVPILTTEEA